jgi:hypothetical protein
MQLPLILIQKDFQNDVPGQMKVTAYYCAVFRTD